METKIISQKSNPFLEREEFLMEIRSDVTPTYAKIKEELGKDNDLTIVNKITTRFGTNKSVANIIVYNNAEAMKKNQVLPQKLRKKLEEERKAREVEEQKKKAEEQKAIEEEEAKKAPEGVPPSEDEGKEVKEEHDEKIIDEGKEDKAPESVPLSEDKGKGDKK